MRLTVNLKSNVPTPSMVVMVVLILFFSSLGFQITSTQAQESPSDLVVDANDEVTIHGATYGLKGSIWIGEGGTLNIVDSTFTVFQDHNRQFEIYVSSGGRLIMEDSTMRSSRALDIYFEENSEITIEGSGMNIPGKLQGYPHTVIIVESDLTLSDVNLVSQYMNISESTLKATGITLSSQEGIFRESILDGTVTFHGTGDVSFMGSGAREVSVRDSTVLEIYSKLILEAVDDGGVPVGDAHLEVLRYHTGVTVVDDHTDTQGAWEGFVHTETIREVESHFMGNLDIRMDYGSSFVRKSISLSPLGNEDVPLSQVIKGVKHTLVFPEVIEPSSYYSTSPNDLYLDNTAKMTVRSYPTEGIHNFVNQGNVILSGASVLTVSADSSLKILQGHKNYRVEIRDEASLVIQEGASLVSDKPLNVYVYDSGSLIFRGGETTLNMLHSNHGSTVDLWDANIQVDRMDIGGSEFILRDSSVSAGRMEIQADHVSITGSQHKTGEDVYVHSSNISIQDSNFDKALYLGGVPMVEITDVRAPALFAQPGTVIQSWRTLDIRILNSHDRYVPSSTVRVYAVTGLSEDLLLEEFVHDGRVSIPLISEVITEDDVLFQGNYVLRGEKVINGDAVYSEETRVGLYERTHVVLRYWQTFPYNLVLDIEVDKTQMEPDEDFVISGVVYYDLEDLEVSHAEVHVSIKGVPERTWHTGTDERGRFTVNASAPSETGRFTLIVEVYESTMEMDAEKEFLLDVGEATQRQGLREFMFETTVGKAITVFIIMVLVAAAYAVIMIPGGKTLRPDPSSSKELVKWAEEVLDKR